MAAQGYILGRRTMPSSSYAVLDEALERLAPYDINLVVPVIDSAVFV
jgi:hypothetical protein